MNIGYVKIDKLSKFNYIIRNLLKKIKVEGNCYYIPSNSEKILKTVREKLKNDGIDYIIQEENIDCGYEELCGKHILKYMIPEVIEYCFEKLGRETKNEEIYICAEQFNKENINIIEELCNKVKVVNIVTNHLRQYQELEKRLERKEIYITVSSNKRKALKRAELIVNLDFNNTKGFNINRNCIIINTYEQFNIGNEFDGILIQKATANTKKIMRIFSEMINMSKIKLIEAEIIKQGDYLKTREFIKNSKLEISEIFGKRNKINLEEFNNIKRKMMNKNIA